MLRTVKVGPHVLVQGRFVKMLETGLMQVQVGSRILTGQPISAS